ncbi:MAG TPA: ABC transporter permease [Gemmatimonadales bacterium]|jgi:spermidine/putrescine transport system permease protein|nr:ABC transporter permease [Gemmatimonadales bacterium]
MRRRASRATLAVAAATYLFLHLPVLILVLFSFNASRYSVTWTGFTLGWYRRLAERTDLLRGLRVSLLVGAISTATATVFGTLLALSLARRRVRGRRVMEALLYLPIVTPEIVAGISLLVWFVALGIPLGIGTITIAHIAFNLAFVAVVVRARLEGMDESLEEAALILGADELTAFRTVTVPQLWPGILAGALLAFTLSFDDYVITSLVAGTGSSTLPIIVYSMVRRNVEPTVNAISTLILVTTSLLIWLAYRLTRERPLATARG